MSEDLEMRRRRALYRAAHRGTKEMDLLMGRFAEARIQDMDEPALSQFERLLGLADPDLQSWILSSRAAGDPAATGRTPVAAEFAGLIKSLRSFHGLC